MTESVRIANHLASLCAGFLHPRYTRGKLRTDPLYNGVFGELKSSNLPLLDIGCGLGILAMYLRERGYQSSIIAIDYDAAKIRQGQKMIQLGGYSEIALASADARAGLPDHSGDVTILDIMQFFDFTEQTRLLRAAAERVAPGGKLVIRSGLAERNIRFFVTWVADIFARCSFWMKSAPIHYPTAVSFRDTLEGEGFEVEIRPFWGKTPFNNYLILARRPGS